MMRYRSGIVRRHVYRAVLSRVRILTNSQSSWVGFVLDLGGVMECLGYTFFFFFCLVLSYTYRVLSVVFVCLFLFVLVRCCCCCCCQVILFCVDAWCPVASCLFFSPWPMTELWRRILVHARKDWLQEVETCRYTRKLRVMCGRGWGEGTGVVFRGSAVQASGGAPCACLATMYLLLYLCVYPAGYGQQFARLLFRGGRIQHNLASRMFFFFFFTRVFI